MHTRRLWRLATIGFGGMIGLCLVAGLLIQSNRPPSFRNHRDTIAYTLQRRGIAFRNIAFQQSFEERNNLLYYRASVQVVRPDGSIVYGWIGCENRDSECVLDLRGLNIRGQSLPELTPAVRMPGWYVWAERTLREIDLRR